MKDSAVIPATHSFTMLRAMVGIGVICGLLIVLTYEGTLPRVERLRAEALQKAIFKVVPGITETRAYTWQNGEFVLADESINPTIHAGYDASGQFKGVAIEASGQGYADVIRILYGYDPEKQKVVGFYVLESKETPGLGDKIEKDQSFLSNFIALDVKLNENLGALLNPVVTVKKGAKEYPWEVDGITGATISSRAIGSIIAESTGHWAPRIYRHKALFNTMNP